MDHNINMKYPDIEDTSAIEQYKKNIIDAFSQVDLSDITKDNKDIKGWIIIPDTTISYPICQTSDNDYTLYFDKVQNRLDLNRKELNNLIEDIENKEYSKVIIKDITQLSRNTIYNINFLQFLEDNNCKIESMDGTDLSLYKKIFDRFNKNKEERER